MDKSFKFNCNLFICHEAETQVNIFKFRFKIGIDILKFKNIFI